MLTDDEFSRLLSKRAPEIKRYLPTPLRHVLPPMSHHLHGDVTSERRFQHIYKLYMSDGELELMLAIILGDGRYEESISILPFTYVPLIHAAASLYADYKHSCCKVRSVQEKLTRDRIKIVSGYDAYDRETEELVAAAQLDFTLFQLAIDFGKAQEQVVKEVLMLDPSMPEKRLLIIPTCAGKHWTAVFVFNPSFIKLARTEWRRQAECLQPCFYHYDPLSPSGTSKVPTCHGTIWFLNLIFSYSEHIKLESAPAEKMKWQAPFPKSHVHEDSDMIVHHHWLTGAEAFPSLRLHRSDLCNIIHFFDEEQITSLFACNSNCCVVVALRCVLQVRNILHKQD